MQKSRDFKYIGKRPLRPDGVEKVTGKALYGADINLPGLLYGKILRSPYAHANILSIDTEAAKDVSTFDVRLHEGMNNMAARANTIEAMKFQNGYTGNREPFKGFL